MQVFVFCIFSILSNSKFSSFSFAPQFYFVHSQPQHQVYSRYSFVFPGIFLPTESRAQNIIRIKVSVYMYMCMLHNVYVFFLNYCFGRSKQQQLWERKIKLRKLNRNQRKKEKRKKAFMYRIITRIFVCSSRTVFISLFHLFKFFIYDVHFSIYSG